MGAGKWQCESRHRNSFLDKNPIYGVCYYRLKQIDYDGHFEYSDNKSIHKKIIGEIRPIVYPNPLASQLQIKHPNFGRHATVKVYDLAGVEVYNSVLESETECTVLDLSALRAGMYLLSLKSENSTENYRIIKH